MSDWLTPFALVIAAWVLGRELKIGLAAAGKHIGTAMATGWAARGLIPKDEDEGAPELEDETTLVQGVDTLWLEAPEAQEMEWVDEVCKRGANASEEERKEAFEKLDYYGRLAKARAAGESPFDAVGQKVPD